MPFITTPTIDNFNRTNESPLNVATFGQQWSTKRIVDATSTNLLKVVTNQCGGIGSSAQNQQYVTGTIGPDCECYVTIPTLTAAGDQVALFARIISPGTTNASGYKVVVTASTSSWILARIDTAVNTTIASASQAFSAGDAFGISCIGSTITGYYKAAAGLWKSILSATDTTYGAKGVIGMQIDKTTARADTFGGGERNSFFIMM